jgi:hypothetical protein
MVAVIVPVPVTECDPVPNLLAYVIAAPAAGVTALDAVEYAPVPTPFVAETLNTTAVPLVSPVTVALVAVDAARVNVVHVEPLLVLTWTV